MSDLPWMPLHPAEFLQQTAEMTTAEAGAYAFLLCYQWDHGSLPADKARLSRIARIHDRAAFDEAWSVLADRFPAVATDPNRLANPEWAAKRIDAIQRRESASERAREAAVKRWDRDREDAGAMPPHSDGMPQAEPPQCPSPSPSPSPSNPPAPNGAVAPQGAGGGKAKKADEKPKSIRPKDPDLVPLPDELEPFVTRLVKHIADQNSGGRILVSRIATIRDKLRETLERIGGGRDGWRYIAFGIQEAISRGATDERYAIAVAKNTHKRGGIPEWAQKAINVDAQPVKRARPPADFNAWDEMAKQRWLKENGYV